MKIVTRLLFMVFIFDTLLHGLMSPVAQKNNTILLGSIALNQTVKNFELPILYKGQEYIAQTENFGDIAHFQLYDTGSVHTLYILVTEYLALPPSTEKIEHLETSTHHPYKLFKITLQKKTVPSSGFFNFIYEWHIEELSNKNEVIIIPDNTIIVFFDPSLIVGLEKPQEFKDLAVINLPTLVIKNTPNIQELAVKMGCALIDFRFLHKKSRIASIPYSNNRILSLPQAPKRIRI